jgi:L-asparaginase II
MRPLQVRSFRGDIEETTHEVVAVIARADGSVVASQGDPHKKVLLRSAAKPFQAAPLFGGAVARFAITAQELALTCASHNSETHQVDLVRAFLERLDVPDTTLVCGPHRSLIKDLGYHNRNGAAEPTPDLAPPSRLASNCSGKHTGMIALARHNDWTPDDYWRPEHGVQQASQESLGAYCDVPTAEIGGVTDGCGVVCWSLPLASLATGYARLASGVDEAARTLTQAMMGHPDLVAGARRLCTALMQAFPGEIVAKVGAGGVYAAGLPAQGLGVAIKILDGNSFAAGVAMLHVLDELQLVPGVRQRLPDYAQPVILNTSRVLVGHYDSTGTLN